MISNSEAYAFTNDHLVKAYSIISTEFWNAHERVSETFDNRADQLEAINELVRLGNAMVKITEARSTLV
jgi:hypothetical protein